MSSPEKFLNPSDAPQGSTQGGQDETGAEDAGTRIDCEQRYPDEDPQ